MATPESMVEEISKLSVEQLRQVKEQVDGEVSVLQDSLNNIRTAANRFEMASKALNMLSQQPPGTHVESGTSAAECLLSGKPTMEVPGYTAEEGHMWNREPLLQNVFIRNTLHEGAWTAEEELNFDFRDTCEIGNLRCRMSVVETPFMKVPVYTAEEGHMCNREPPLHNVLSRNTIYEGACVYCRGGKKMLVPLTASLYASGTLANTDNVLVDVGTGYFIEKSLPDGKDYCERKIKFLKENHQKLVEVANGKQNAAEQINMVLQAKMRSAAQPARG